MERNDSYSQELNDIIARVNDVLIVEFPNNEILPEYLLLSILETKRSHAYLILDNYLMSNNIECLRQTYTNVIASHSKGINGSVANAPVRDSNELIRLFQCALNEKNKTKADLLSSEHILLALLQPENRFHQIQVLKVFGLDYTTMLVKCSVDNHQSSNLNSENNPQMRPNQVPLKSQINVKALTGKSNYIEQFTINLNNLVTEGKIDDLVGRDREINEIIKTMARRTKNNVILVGAGGCGKTHIVNGIAIRLANNQVPTLIEGREIVMLNVMALIAGTHLRGMFEERVKGLFEELKESNKYILFIDDIQTVLKNGSKEKDCDMSDMLGNCLNDKRIIVIAAAEPKAYKNAIEPNPAIARKFQKIMIEPTSIEETVNILQNNKKYYESHHNVKYTDDAIKLIPKLADRYITTRSLPDSAFDIMDMAGAKRCFVNNDPIEIVSLKRKLIELAEDKENSLNNGEFEKIDDIVKEENAINLAISDYKRSNLSVSQNPLILDENEITETVSEMTGIPIKSLSVDERKKIAHIDDVLKQTIIGQDEAIEKVCRSIKRNKVGLGNKNRVMLAALLIGNSGSGKTLLAKELARLIFGSDKDLIRIDMSEYSEKNSISKLVGSAPGYVGFENGGQLTEAIKNKQHCVLLLDEIEKADQEIYNIFLQLLDEGRLTDSSGQLVNFKNVIVIMTSNVGAKQAVALGNGLGFKSDTESNQKAIYEKELKKKFSPEFLNRIDQIVYFNSLSDENLKNIVKLEIDKLNTRLNELKYSISYSDDVVSYIHAEALKQKEYGARPIIRLVQDNIEDKITDLMLENDYPLNYEFKAVCQDNNVIVS